jgi:hypothetical protein
VTLSRFIVPGLRNPHPWAKAYCVRCKRPHSLLPDECGCLCRHCCACWDGDRPSARDRQHEIYVERTSGWHYHRD